MCIFKLLRNLFFAVMLSFTASAAMGQTPEIDSLKLLLNRAEVPESRIDLMNELAQRLYRIDTDSAMYYAKQAQGLAQKSNFQKGLADAYRKMGMINASIGENDEALVNFKKSASICEHIGYMNGLGNVHNNTGFVYRRLGQYAKSVNFYLKAKQIAESENDKDLLAKVHNNLGIVLGAIGEHDSAVDHYYKSIRIKTELNQKLSLGPTYTNLGMVKLLLKEYDQAEEYFRQAMELDSLENDDWGIANSLENFGLLNLEQKQYDQARMYFERSLEKFTTLKDRNAFANNLTNLGRVYYEKKDYNHALKYFNEALSIYDDIGNQVGKSDILLHLAKCNKETGQKETAILQARQALALAQTVRALKEAVYAVELLYHIYGESGDGPNSYQYSQQYMQLKDSLYDVQKIEYIAKLESKQQLTLIQQQNEWLTKENLLKGNELKASNLELEKQNVIQLSLLVCLLFALTAAVFWFRYNIKKKLTIKLLSKLNAEITSQKEQIATQANELEKVNAEMRSMNDSLEYMVKERTTKIESQNKKLRDYAFSNSHEVRAPLSNLLGLINVSKLEGMPPAEQQVILEKINATAIELDQVITKVNKLLEDEGI